MTRSEYRQRQTRLRSVSGKDALRSLLDQTRNRIRREIIPDPSAIPGRFQWKFIVPGPNGHSAIEGIDVANTKSEVRAKIKTALGEIPQGTMIVKTGRSPRQGFINQRVKEFHERNKDQPGGDGSTKECVGELASVG